jgi:ribosomal RNA-processing protein 1
MHVPPPAPLSTLLEPFLHLAAHTNNSTTYKQVQSTVFEPLLHALQPSEEQEDNSDDEGRGGGGGNRRKRPRLSLPTYSHLLEHACLVASRKDDKKLTKAQLRRGVLKQMFEVASKEETRDVNRRRMYAICKSELDEDSEGDES